jgi:hypothetical protein
MEAKGRDVDFLEDPEAELQLASDFQPYKIIHTYLLNPSTSSSSDLLYPRHPRPDLLVSIFVLSDRPRTAPANHCTSPSTLYGKPHVILTHPNPIRLPDHRIVFFQRDS